MEGAKMSQKEYLRKYLSGNDDSGKKKKKKKKSKVGPKTVTIIDDDVDVKNMRPLEVGEFDIFNTTEDAPVIVGVVDERGPVDFADKRRWRIIADDGEGNVACSISENRKKVSNDSSGSHKAQKKASKHSTDPVSPKRIGIASDLSPPRVSKRQSRKEKVKSKKRKSAKERESSSDSSDSSSEKEPSHRRTKSGKSETISEKDLSPPRKQKRNQDSNSRENSPLHDNRWSRKNSDSDFSPPRKQKRSRKSNSRENSPIDNNRRSRKNCDSDFSPPRDSKQFRDSRSSRTGKSLENRRTRRNSDSDLSPPRKQKTNRDSNSRENSPTRNNRRRRKNSDSDLSPPRDPKQFRDSRSTGKRKTSENRRTRKNSDSDLSPPRNPKRVSRNSDSDLSPPRKSKNDREKSTDRTLPKNSSRRNNEKSSRGSRFSSRSPVRKSRALDSDLSPPRPSRRDLEERKNDFQPRYNEKHDRHRSRGDETSRRSPKPSRSRWSDAKKSKSPEVPEKNKDGRMTKRLDGKSAGLLDARALRIETEELKKREAEMFNNMSAEVSGVGQAAVMRDRRTGKRRDLNAEAMERREKEKRQQEIDEKYAKWGKGLKQVEDQAEKRKRDLHEMNKPLARYANDADLDKELRAVMHPDDPMMEYIKSKQIKEGKREPDKPSYHGSYMPNRFGIKPGHRWDGVDRGNGYEKKWFEARNARTANEEEAFKWSTADM